MVYPSEDPSHYDEMLYGWEDPNPENQKFFDSNVNAGGFWWCEERSECHSHFVTGNISDGTTYIY